MIDAYIDYGSPISAKEFVNKNIFLILETENYFLEWKISNSTEHSKCGDVESAR